MENKEFKKSYEGKKALIQFEYKKIIPTKILIESPADLMEAITSEYIKETGEYLMRMFRNYEINLNVVMEQQEEINRLRQLIEDHIKGKYVPVVHGKPIVKNRLFGGFRQRTGMDYRGETHTITVDERWIEDVKYCPICRALLCSRHDNYCPNCGAKMDLEV